MCEPVFWNDLSAFVDGILRLDVEWSEENSWDLSDFAEWKRDCKTSDNIIGYEFLEEFFLFVCTFVVSKIEGIFDILYSVLFVGHLDPYVRILFILFQLGWFSKIGSSISMGLNSDP